MRIGTFLSRLVELFQDADCGVLAFGISAWLMQKTAAAASSSVLVTP